MMKFSLENDVFFSKEYVATYVNISKGEEIFEFEYSTGNKKFRTISIKRPIPFMPDYYDLETAYGYGGYLVNTEDIDFIKEAIEEYTYFCKTNNIVAEFIRFHPFNNFPKDHSLFDFIKHNRNVVYIDLTLEKHYQSSLRRNIKKAENYNLNFFSVPYNKKEKYLDEFIKLYYETMMRKKASKFYFFSKDYFTALFKLKATKLYLVLYKDIIINAIIVLESPPFVYYHLGATKSEFYSLNTNPFIFDRIIDVYKLDTRFNIFYLGGGTTGKEDDPLYKFKRKFSPLTKPYFIAGKIFNHELYTTLSENYNATLNKFLKWR